MQPSLLRINNLSVDFLSEGRRNHALKNISLDIQKSEIVAVVGESGSGKTVTSLSILNLLPKSAEVVSGEILIDYQNTRTDLLKAHSSVLKDIRGNRISMIFQEPMTSLNPVMKCGKQVAEVLQRHRKISKRQAFQRTVDLFKKVRLPNPENIFYRYPHELSGGQKQRVMIAMAVGCEPELLIADEPTTALDVMVQKSIVELLKELQQSMGMGVLYITHDLGLVKEIADRVVVMYRGDIIETGTREKIFTNPEKDYTKALLSCHPRPEYKGKPLPMVSDFIKLKDEEILHFSAVLSNGLKHENTEGNNLIEVKNLSVKYPLKKNFFGKILTEYNAVDHVSFNIKRGETLGLVGESGCGKTTLGRVLLRLINPSSGQVFMDGQDFLGINENELRDKRKEIQIVFQDPYGSLNPRITIGSAIREPLDIHRIGKNERQRKDKTIELLERVGLKAEHYDRYPHEFSGGQRQRICIARALTVNPGFIVFDESVSALDVSVQAQVLNLLSDLKREYGFTAVFISHDLSVVYYISDRIMVMQKGKIVESGSAADVFFHPKEEYTRNLIEAIPGRE
ncbi:MAG: ABC transporter ATP-binding protein [Chitinophagaceae bacterium]|nr:ABC transporter ATP-binding protein [Chitinophagaceae bacterium]